MDEIITKAILVSLDLGEYDADTAMDELSELAKTAQCIVVGTLVQKKDAPNAGLVLGEGKTEELRDLCVTLEANLVIYDRELTSSEIRNIEKIISVRVIDRTMLILHIFADRALTSEGKLQVELAQLKYRLPRLIGLGASMSRLGGGIGTRGPGETQLETDRRHIRRRIQKLEDEFAELSARRLISRTKRRHDGTITVAIVGYTNTGKSTLLNTLTAANVEAENKLFCTLDLTSRNVTLNDGRNVIFIDTVGLIRRLPHNLIEAFKSTLEEAAYADLILNVCDISDPLVTEKRDVTLKLLDELHCGEIPVITVLNKIDLVEGDVPITGSVVRISAKTGVGIDNLLLEITRQLPAKSQHMELLVPYDKVGIIAKIRENGKVLSEVYGEDGVRIDAHVPLEMVKDGMVLGL